MGSSLSNLVSDPNKFATKVNPDGTDEDVSKWKSYDYVIAGGGTAGCILASRLSEDRNATVLLIEAGKSEGDLFSRMPLTFSKSFGTDIDWAFVPEPQESMSGRVISVPRGKVLGGTSILNCLIYDRCSPEDFNSWAKNGAEGWAFKDVEPYFRKLEGYVPEKFIDKVDFSTKGRDGPIVITQDDCAPELNNAIFESWKALGVDYVDDVNSHNKLGATRFQGCVDLKGTRSSVVSAYLTPEVLARPNLTIAVNNRVEKVLFSRDASSELKAIGVQVTSSPNYPSYRLAATREVIVCGGAIHTPHILLLSGVGPKEELEKVGVAPMKDLPVGRHLVDHISCGPYLFRTKPGYTLDYLNHSPLAAIKPLVQWLFTGKGVFSKLPVPTAAWVRSDDPKLMDTSIGTVRDVSSGPNSPDLEILWSPILAPSYTTPGPPGVHGITISAIALKAESEGTVTLKTNSVWDKPIVNGNYFSSENDLYTVLRGVRLIQRLSQTEPLKSILAPKRDNNDKESLFWPSDVDPEKLSDDELKAWILRHGHSTCHIAGSCSIGPVLTPELKVHGIPNLRVVDASVFPTQVSGHPVAVVFVFAEKAADMIKASWK
ncbi:GMC oxidoreductase [Abortiporus biennis]|nr:GMC oxidoreductase [Abortiporus biennis]